MWTSRWAIFWDADRFRVPPRVLESGVGTGDWGMGTGVAVETEESGVGVRVGGTRVGVGLGDAVGDGMTTVGEGAVVGEGSGIGSTSRSQPITKLKRIHPSMAGQTVESLMWTSPHACFSFRPARLASVLSRRCLLLAGISLP